MVQPTTKIKLMKIFDSVNLQYENKMYTQTGVLNALFLTRLLLVLICDVNSKLLQVEVWSSASQRIVINISANASNRTWKQGGGEGYHVQRPWQEVWSRTW